MWILHAMFYWKKGLQRMGKGESQAPKNPFPTLLTTPLHILWAKATNQKIIWWQTSSCIEKCNYVPWLFIPCFLVKWRCKLFGILHPNASVMSTALGSRFVQSPSRLSDVRTITPMVPHTTPQPSRLFKVRQRLPTMCVLKCHQVLDCAMAIWKQ